MSKKHRQYPLRIPRHAGGIRLQEPAVPASRSWWARSWREAVEAMNLGPRQARGLHYARSGQVVALDFAGNRIAAQVVGVRSEPYRVECVFSLALPSVRGKLIAAIRSEPVLVARLLAGELPYEIDGIFASAGARLFPGGKLGPGSYDVTISCSCPDWKNPCKHAAAVLAVAGEAIAADPALLLALRGIEIGALADED